VFEMKKCQVCDKDGKYFPIVLYKPAAVGPAMRFPLPDVFFCEGCSDASSAAKILTAKNIKTIEEALKEQGFVTFERKRLSVGFSAK
jgi:hypothetical protein